MRRFSSLLILVAAAAFVVPSAAAATDALPDMVMVKPSGSQVKLDTTTLPGHTLLRYTATIKNIGAGALEADATRVDTSSPWTVSQRVFDDAGGSRLVPTGAQVVWGGDGHEHWHIVDFETGELFNQAGQSVGVLAKHGFCFEDTKGPHNGTRVYDLTGCGGFDPNALSLRMGISSGWSDVYGWDFVGQFIDVTGLSGRYTLRICANPALGFVEASTANQCVEVSVRL